MNLNKLLFVKFNKNNIMDKKELPKIIYFDEKVGTNGIHCLDYENESEVSYIRTDLLIDYHKKLEAIVGLEGEIDLSNIKDYLDSIK